MKTKSVALLLVGTALVSGCANTSLRVAKPVTERPKSVTLSIDNQSKSPSLEEEMLGLKEVLTDKLQDEGIKVVANDKDAYRLTGEFANYESGNRALRWFVGFGVGKASYDSNWKLVSASGEVLGNCNIDGYVRMGFTGGSLSGMHKDLGEAVADCVKGER
ncbi:MAG TPA: DUF4410 domain-containing protein [Geomonas sp.]|nr:DUF4410 domain-containing protein [Geomonas sp.]